MSNIKEQIRQKIEKKKGKSYYPAMIELLNMIEPPRWISVNEKLPPEDEEVIVLTNEANGHTLPIACHLCFAHIVSDKTMFVDYDGWNIPQVRYWMPCPELPEK